jgi:hypothetical protein
VTTTKVSPFIEVWLRNLAEAAQGRDVLGDADDRAAFRGEVQYRMRNLKWSGMVEVARYLGADLVPRSRGSAARICADRWIARLRREASS